MSAEGFALRASVQGFFTLNRQLPCRCGQVIDQHLYGQGRKVADQNNKLYGRVVFDDKEKKKCRTLVARVVFMRERHREDGPRCRRLWRDRIRAYMK